LLYAKVNSRVNEPLCDLQLSGFYVGKDFMQKKTIETLFQNFLLPFFLSIFVSGVYSTRLPLAVLAKTFHPAVNVTKLVSSSLKFLFQ